MNSPIFNPNKITHGIPAAFTPLGVAGQIEDAAKTLVNGMGLKSIAKDLSRVAKAIAHAPAALVESLPFASMMKDIVRVAGLVADTPKMLAHRIAKSGGGSHQLQHIISHSRVARNLHSAVRHLHSKLVKLNIQFDKKLAATGKFIEDLANTVGRLLEGGMASVMGAAKTLTLSALKKGAQAFFVPPPAVQPKRTELSLQPQVPADEVPPAKQEEQQEELAKPAQVNGPMVWVQPVVQIEVVVYHARALILQQGGAILISTCLLYLPLQLWMVPPMILLQRL